MAHSVLIIDDDDSTRLLLTRVLEDEGYVTFTAANGAEGVRRLVASKPCVILLDFEMPVMDGHDFHEVQRRVAPDVPIICVTGAAEPALKARIVGACSVQAKPMDLDVLCSTIADLCRRPHEHLHDPTPVAVRRQRGGPA
jgi:CheY-like chemotaxis protein